MEEDSPETNHAEPVSPAGTFLRNSPGQESPDERSERGRSGRPARLRLSQPFQPPVQEGHRPDALEISEITTKIPRNLVGKSVR